MENNEIAYTGKLDLLEGECINALQVGDYIRAGSAIFEMDKAYSKITRDLVKKLGECIFNNKFKERGLENGA